MDSHISSIKPYEIMEQFTTLQGEGFFTGHSAYFVRLAGCDVQCPWCDVPESWERNKLFAVDFDKLEKNISESPSEIIVVTGGEPTMHHLGAMTDLIHLHNKKAHIETSGTNPLTGEWDWVCFSPKRYKKPLPEYYQIADELKIIIAHDTDFRWAEEWESNMHPHCKLYIQVEWGKRDAMMSTCIDFVRLHPRWTLSLQTHKYLNIP